MAEAPWVSFVVQSSSTYSTTFLAIPPKKKIPPNLPNHFAKQKDTQKIEKPGGLGAVLGVVYRALPLLSLLVTV